MHGKVEHKGECHRCSRCCAYFCLEVDAPEDRRDWEDYAWIVAHEGAALHISGDTWQLVVHNRCRYLDGAGHCAIYENRPAICREHIPGDCERDQEHPHDYDDVDHVITTIDQLWSFRDSEIKRRRSEAARKAARTRRKRSRGRRKA